MTLHAANGNSNLSDPAKLAEMYGQVKVLQQIIEAYDTALKTAVEEKGSLMLPDGRELKFVHEDREEIDVEKCVEPLGKWFGDKLFKSLCDSGALTISKGKLLDAVGEIAAKGRKGKDKAACMEDLREAGAVKTKTIRKLSAKKGA